MFLWGLLVIIIGATPAMPLNFTVPFWKSTEQKGSLKSKVKHAEGICWFCDCTSYGAKGKLLSII